MPDVELDRTDLRLLELLQHDGRITNADLAEKVEPRRIGLPAARATARAGRRDRRAMPHASNRARSGWDCRPSSACSSRVTTAESIAHFIRRVEESREVVACHALTGDMDYLLHVIVEDLDHFSRFLLDRLLNDSGVADVNSSFVLRTVKQAGALPL